MADEIDKTLFFIAAAGFAKAIAKERSDCEITPLTFLAGLKIAAAVATGGDDAQLVADNSDAIKVALRTRDLALPENEIEPLEDKMPLSAGLKDVLNSNRHDLGKFLNALLDVVSPVTLADNPLASTISHYITDYLAVDGGDEIGGDVFAAAAFSAFENGEFRDHPGLTSFFSTNRPYLTALVDKVFQGMRSAKLDVLRLPNISKELKSALRGQDDGAGARFVAAVDIGLATGVNIVSDRVTAYHEAGHAVVSSVLRPEIPINRILVKREQDYDGVTIPDANSPHFSLMRRSDYLSELCVLLAGQAAQGLKFGQGYYDQGATSDIEKATKRAWRSIAWYGLDLEFGPVDLSIFEEKSGWLYDEAQKRLQVVMKEAAARTDKILKENWIKLEATANALIATGEVDFEQFVAGLAMNGLENVPGALRAQNIPVVRDVTFVSQPGSHQTPEGSVLYEAGDALVTGENGDCWPITRAVFEKLYAPINGSILGQNGRYEKPARHVLALPLEESTRVDMSGGRGLLLGTSGDWIVDYGSGDMAIVAGATFSQLYQITE